MSATRRERCMKRFTATTRFAALSLALALLAVAAAAAVSLGCARAGELKVGESEVGEPGAGKLRIVCTMFPQFDWVRQILGDKQDNYVLEFLQSSRVDLHSYQPAVDDIVKITTCDLFIYVGGESDAWVDGALNEAMNKDMIVINLLEALGSAAKVEEAIEGADERGHGGGDGDGGGGDGDGEGGDGDDDGDGGEGAWDGRGGDNGDNDDGGDGDGGEGEWDGHGDGGEAGYDEHVWLSLKNARTFGFAIAEALSSLDADNADYYRSNMAAYAAQLSALDEKYRAAADAAPVKTLLFGDRFPFRYLFDDYGIGYYAAFAGCSTETEASFSTIVFLVRKVDELRLKSLMVTESSDRKIAETIIRESNGKDQKILALDAMQSVTASDIENGETYLAIMEGNLDTLVEAMK